MPDVGCKTVDLMRRYPRYASVSYSFGPGPVSRAVKIIIWANVGVFVLTTLVRQVTPLIGLVPQLFFERLWLWQAITYMFVHADVFHILINMLGVWMFGVELERLWGTRFFVRYYFITGLGAAAATLLMAVLPLAAADRTYHAITMGASGSLYGVLLAFALYYPERPILMFLLFPIPAKYFVMIIGAIAFLASTGSGGGIAHTAHLGGLVVGYFYLKGFRGGLTAEIKYRYLRWKMARLRRRFDVYSGGRRDDWDRRIH